jgi:arylsulfatase A-like enzyme
MIRETIRLALLVCGFVTGARSPEEREESGGVELGAKTPASNGNLRGGKGSLHEGGVRVPTIFYWPTKPSIVNEPLDMVDVMPTVLALAGAQGSSDHPFDGGHLADLGTEPAFTS